MLLNKYLLKSEASYGRFFLPENHHVIPMLLAAASLTASLFPDELNLT